MKLRDHIPPSILERNPAANSFVRVLDGMADEENNQLSLFDSFINFYVNKEPSFKRKFFYELGQMVMFTGMPERCIELLIKNSNKIFGLKGSLNGLKLFVESCCEGTVTVDFSSWWPAVMLIPGHPVLGRLPNGADLLIATNTPRRFNYIFGGSFMYYYSSSVINIKSDLLIGNDQYRRDIAMFIPEMLPMSDPATSFITIFFYDNANNLLETINL